MTSTAVQDLLAAAANRPDRYGAVSINKTQRVFTPHQMIALLRNISLPDNEVLLSVPYIPQEGAGATRYRNDCGPACIAMLLAYAGLSTPSVDDLSSETGLRTSDIGLTTQAMINLGNTHGLRLSLAKITPDILRAEVAAGRPVIPLISYAPLTGRLNQVDVSGHFVVVTGYDPDSYFINDPDWYTKGDKTAEDGHHWRVPRSEFEQAMQVSPVPYQAAITAPVIVQPPPQVYAQGVDISHWQVVTDIELLAKSYDFVIMKATEGYNRLDPTKSYVDRMFKTWQAQLSGKVLIGAYHFGTGADPLLQARHFVNTVQPDGRTALWLDFELNPDNSATSEGNMTAAQADAFINEVERLTGKVCGLYTRANLVPAGQHGFYRVPLWVASYNAVPTMPPGWITWSIQQYNNGASGPAPYTAPGLAGTCDHDRFNGDKAALGLFWPTISGSVIMAPPPPPPPPPQTPAWSPYWVNSDPPFRLGINIHTEPSLNSPVIGSGYDNHAKVLIDLTTLQNGYVRDKASGGWIAFKYLTDTPPAGTPTPTASRAMWGINTDPYNPAGNPSAQQLAGVNHVRFVFKVASQSQTLVQAFVYYDPIIAAYVAKGTRVILIINQETFTDKIPYQNNGQTWAGYTPGYAAGLATIAAHYSSTVYAYEIWNEGDVQGQPTSVYIPPADYAVLLKAAYTAVGGRAKVIIGGLASGDPVSYLAQVGPTSSSCDGIGLHPYGKVSTPITGLPNTGLLSTYLDKVHTVFPTLPLWITEFGVPRVNVLDQSLWPRIAQYMKDCFALLAARTDVQAAIWFAWSDAMDNAGIVSVSQQPKGDIFNQFYICAANDGDKPAPPPVSPPPTPTPTPTPVPPTTGGWGLHYLGAQGDRSGDKYPVAKAVDNPGLLQQLYAAKPDRMLIHRHWLPDDEQTRRLALMNVDMNGALNQWFSEMTPELAALPFAYFESLNEVDMPPQYLEFERQRAIRLTAMGRKIAAVNIAAGHSTDAMWQAAKGMVDAVIANGGIIGEHCYSLTVMTNGNGPNYVDAGGNWVGELFPAAINPDDCWTGYRIMKSRKTLAQQGQALAVMVATEFGFDDMGGTGRPYLFGVKTQGWKQCAPLWERAGWLTNTSAAQFMIKQFDHWAKLTGCLGVVYTYGTGGNPKWESDDVTGVL